MNICVQFHRNKLHGLLIIALTLAGLFNVSLQKATFEPEQSTEKLTGLSRCPVRTDEPGVYLFSDKKLCNVYHECNCTSVNGSNCNFVKTNVCPIGTVFLNMTNRCEPIDIFGCETSYLQWISSSKVGKNMNETGLEKDYDQTRKGGYDFAAVADSLLIDIPPEPVNITGMSEFMCPYGSNERFADPQICNIFHVCVSRGDQTYDQPFLCPYGSVFRVIDSKTMYCDKKKKSDCRDKAFYRSIEDEDTDYGTSSNYKSNLYIETNNNTKCINGEKMDDKLFCNTYHICKGNRFEHYICENQLLFNPLSLMCDYPINVACYNKQIFKRQDLYMVNQNKQQQQQQTSQKSFNSMQNLVNSQNASAAVKNVSVVNIYGVKIELKCPLGAKNYLIPDKTYCNIFHHCHGNSGNIFMCEKGQAFDALANGPDKSGVCNFEDLVNCAGKYILTEEGPRVGQAPKPVPQAQSSPRSSYPNNNYNEPNPQPSEKSSKQGSILNLNSNFLPQSGALSGREELVSGIPFDCRGKSNGHWRDIRYCDVFHACIGGEQKKTYSCAQLGERIYFDETTRRCEFIKNNPGGCANNAYFQQVTQPQTMAGVLNNQIVSEESNEGWKQFIRSREAFSCLGRMDGFYASRWCNVFYRCFIGVKTEFLCPKMLNSDRLWWVQHGSSQETPQTSAACVWPCETKKQCLSPGGSIIENGDGSYGESPIEADRIWRSSNCADEAAVSDIFKIPDQDFSCIGLPEGNFYPSKYCNVFHRCTSGKRKDFQCAKATNSPYDLWWNEATNQCDWPCKVSCNKPVYGTQKPAALIQAEDRGLNEEECRKARIAQFEPSHQQQQQQQQSSAQSGPIPKQQPQPQMPQVPQQPPVPSLVSQVIIPTRQIPKPFADENFMCPGTGQFVSFKYCNIYYECKLFGHPPVASFYCTDGYFDGQTRTCRPTNEVNCPYNPPLMYPYLSIAEANPPEEVGCSNNIGYYTIHSNRYCNIYYTCDGRSTKPQAFRCYDRLNGEDGVYNRDTRRCESKRVTPCQGEVFYVKLRYQSSPVDHTRLPDLQPLSCRGDQQYLAEHDKYCNLYHSCILGKYQMYVCLTIGSFDKTSYFYYTNGDCAAPNQAQCGPNKTIYPYEKLFPSEPAVLYQPGSLGSSQRGYMPVISPSISYTGQANFGSVSLKTNLPYSPECDAKSDYLIPHHKFCNIFYECSSGKLSTYACVDSSTGLFSGIFDDKIKSCKPFNSADCPSNSLFNPEESAATNIEPYLFQQSIESGADIKYTMDTSFKTESNFTCMGRPNGYYESEWCNVFYRCIDGKRIDAKCSSGIKSGSFIEYDLWWEYQNTSYDPNNPIIFMGPDEDAKCEWPCKVKCNKPVWIAKGLSQSSKTIIDRDNELHPDCFVNQSPKSFTSPPLHEIQYQAFETDNVNPSGFFCENDGTYRDPIFCNLFHICFEKERKTYHCKSIIDDHKVFAVYDPDKKACVSKEEGIAKCNGIIYDPNFMNLPAYRDLPLIKQPCTKSGVSVAYDKDVRYCDLFYWCEKANSEPLYFYCDVAVFGKGKSYFNPDSKKCELSVNVNCPLPHKIYSTSVYNMNRFADKVGKDVVEQLESFAESNTKLGLGQPSPYMMQIVSGLLDPAPGYSSLAPTQFSTNFRCPLNAPGYYPNTEYCDIFHYCYTNGQYKTYVCASMQNQYQLWWSHQTEPGRRDNIFCDWPCNLVGPNTVCPPNKRVLMRDRQQVPGGIDQQEVLTNTCPNTATQAPAQPQFNNNQAWRDQWTSTNKPPSPYNGIAVGLNKASWNNNNNNNINIGGSNAQTNSPCPNSAEWFISSQNIRCNSEQRIHGFAPDPKDCSKYYRCDQNIGSDGTSTGYLMSCIAGLWWDQQRRMCVLPTEVSCNPYNIINNFSNDQGGIGAGSLCKGMTCSQTGITKTYMKAARGKPGSYLKCEGLCAIELSCPHDLLFDEASQKCDWPQPQARMASLKAAERFIMERNLDTHFLDESVKTVKMASYKKDAAHNATKEESIHIPNYLNKFKVN